MGIVILIDMKTKTTIYQLLVIALIALSACGEAQTGTSGKPFDEPGNLIAPPPAVFSDIIFFATDNIYLGNMGGREGVDEICNTEKPSEANGRQVRAFISVDVDDSVDNMSTNYDVPSNLPIVTTLDLEIASNWSDLTDGSIAISLSDALPNMQSSSYYWTGTMPNGQAGAAPCDGWTNTSGGADAGNSDAVDGQWLSAIGSICSFGRKVLCIAF